MAEVRELRIALTTSDFQGSVHFYCNVLGLEVREQFVTDHGNGVILEAGTATLEILDGAHAAYVDEVEVGRRVAGPLRLAFQVDDAAATTRDLAKAGATILAEPTRTPWDSMNSRLEGPDGVQLTIFEEPGTG